MVNVLAQKKARELINMLKLNVEKQLTSFNFRINHHFGCSKITTILGVSGAGKTTFINLLNGLTKPDLGEISFANQCYVNTKKNFFMPPEKRQIATIFQDPLLFPHLTVAKNLCYSRKPSIAERVDSIVDLLNIGSLLNRFPSMLSGGEKQRVAIGRALLSEPKLLLMDEPLSSLDMPRKKDLICYINQFIMELNIPIIYVTHSLYEAKALASEIIVLEQGQLKQYGDAKRLLAGNYFHSW